MKRLLMLAAALLVAAPLAAAEGDQTAKKKAEEEAAKKAAAAKAAAAPAQEDSPLVAAAKRSKRLGKNPTNLITNETVGANKSGGHITTSSTQAELPVSTKPDAPRPSLADMERARVIREQEQKRLEADAAAKKARLAAMERQAAESLGIDEDPTAFEAGLEQARKEAAEAEKKAKEAAQRRP